MDVVPEQVTSYLFRLRMVVFGGNEVYFLHVHPILSPNHSATNNFPKKQIDLPIFAPFRLFHFFRPKTGNPCNSPPGAWTKNIEGKTGLSNFLSGDDGKCEWSLFAQFLFFSAPLFWETTTRDPKLANTMKRPSSRTPWPPKGVSELSTQG